MEKLNNAAITRIRLDRFRVAFGALRARGLASYVPAFAKTGPVSVDPYFVGQAIRGTMQRSDTRSVDGRPLVWNEYEVFLSQEDYQRILPLERGLKSGLDSAIRATLKELGAETIGDLMVRILVDEESDCPQGTGEIVVGFVDNANLRPEAEGEPTVRVRRTASQTAQEPTQRVSEPAVDGALQLTWPRGDAVIPPFQKFQVGRPHNGVPQQFVALIGASQRINSYQLAIENVADGAVITRPTKANPVQVAGRLLQPGGKMAISELPVEISLSNGDLVLRLENLAS